VHKRFYLFESLHIDEKKRSKNKANLRSEIHRMKSLLSKPLFYFPLILVCVFGWGRPAFAKPVQTEAAFKKWLHKEAPLWPKELGTMYITIDPVSMDKIRARRKKNIYDNYQFSPNAFFVPAKFEINGEKAKGKIRLKGDGNDHWSHEFKWSFRIKLKRKSTLMGMRVMTIQSPATRSDMWEWATTEATRHEGGMAVRYRFIYVVLNGKKMGVYALEEGIDKHLVEYHRRRENPVLKIDEDPLWNAIFYHGMPRLPFFSKLMAKQGNMRVLDQWYISSIETFNKKSVYSNPVLKKSFDYAAGRFEAFRRGRVRASQVFDIDRWSNYIALTQLFQANHNLGVNNLRLYPSPVTGLIEPIGFDFFVELYRPKSLATFRVSDSKIPGYDGGRTLLLVDLFRDPEFWKLYKNAVSHFSKPGTLESFIRETKQDYYLNLQALRSYMPDYYLPWGKVFESRNGFRRSTSSAVRPQGQEFNPAQLHAVFVEEKNKIIKLKVANRTRQKLVLKSLKWDFDNVMYHYPGSITLQPVKNPSDPEYVFCTFTMGGNQPWKKDMEYDLYLSYLVEGEARGYAEKVYVEVPGGIEFTASDPLNASLSPLDVNWIELKNGRFEVKKGQWKIDRTIFIASKVPIYAGPGVSFELGNGASLVFEAPLKWVGKKDEPIRVTGVQGGGGVLVMKANERSRMQYVEFSGLSSPAGNGWANTGAVTFYEADVDIRNCLFQKNESEDALNIIRSTFSLVDSVFRKIKSDAFDGDFIDGLVANTEFTEVGNDALDFSGSTIEMKNIQINGAGDKAISAGENTKIKAKGIKVQNTEIAVASKDLSLVEVDGLDIKKCSLGFAVYQKKSEFGPAVVTAENVVFSSVKEKALVEPESNLVLNGEDYEKKDEQVKAKLYGSEYGEKTK